VSPIGRHFAALILSEKENRCQKHNQDRGRDRPTANGSTVKRVGFGTMEFASSARATPRATYHTFGGRQAAIMIMTKKGRVMLEIKLCATCGGFRCAEHQPEVRQANFNREILGQRACSDCCEYALVGEMTTTPAGNVICPRCAKRRERTEASRRQLAMFGQAGLFES